jgi:menaquinone-specific isochorismate synthase
MRNLTIEELHSFLKSGLIMGLGPSKCLVAWGDIQRSNKPKADLLQFFIPDFYLEVEKPWVTFTHTTVTERSALMEALENVANQPKLDLKWDPPKFEEFKTKFEMIQNEIKKGELRKAVPVMFERSTGTMTLSMRASILKNLLKNAIKPNPYGYWTPHEGLMGATPEILFTYNARTNELETMALAGTRASANESKSSLANDPKEMFEHDLVIQGLKEKLSKLGDLQVSPTYVWDLGLISHLRTDMSVELKTKPVPAKIFTDVCELLHPTAALGVAPNRADWRFLKKCDGVETRGHFGAPFGVLSPTGKSIVLVAIRNIQWHEDQLTVGAGCGVVGQSELPNEWQELEVKRQAVHALLGL